MNNMQQILKIFSEISLGPTSIPKTDLTDSGLKKDIQTFLSIAAAVALLVIVISSFRMVISRGNSQDIAKARDAIIYATIGLIITMTALGIVTFVVGRL